MADWNGQKVTLSEKVGTDPTWAGRARMATMALSIIGPIAFGAIGWIGTQVWGALVDERKAVYDLQVFMLVEGEHGKVRDTRLGNLEVEQRDQWNVIHSHDLRLTVIESGGGVHR